MTDQREISPSERQVISSVIGIWEESPATQNLGCAKLLALVKQSNPDWALSEKRLKGILKQHGLQNSTQQTTFASKVESKLIPNLGMPEGVTVQMTKSKGRALFATGKFEAGDELWNEHSLIPIPSLDMVNLMRKSLACALCTKTFKTRKDGVPQGGSECNLCDAKWCSVECHKKDIIHAGLWHHNPRSKVDEGKWRAFEKTCVANDWQAGYAAGVMLTFFAKDSSKNHELRQKLDSMARIRQDEVESMLDVEVDSSIRTECFELLRDALKPCIDLTLEDFMYTLGGYNLNQFEGNIYLYRSHLNHSCDANVRIEFIEEGIRTSGIRAIALRRIHPNEELVIDYLDAGDHDLSKRRQELRTRYGFICNCTKCKLQDKQVNDAAQAALEGNQDELALHSELHAKLRPRRKSVRFSEQNTTVKVA